MLVGTGGGHHPGPQSQGGPLRVHGLGRGVPPALPRGPPGGTVRGSGERTSCVPNGCPVRAVAAGATLPAGQGSCWSRAGVLMPPGRKPWSLCGLLGPTRCCPQEEGHSRRKRRDGAVGVTPRRLITGRRQHLPPWDLIRRDNPSLTLTPSRSVSRWRTTLGPGGLCGEPRRAPVALPFSWHFFCLRLGGHQLLGWLHPPARPALLPKVPAPPSGHPGPQFQRHPDSPLIRPSTQPLR